MHYSTVVFDWDGTLIDSTHSIAVAIQKACQAMGFQVPTLQKARWVIGLSLDQALKKVVPELPASRLDEFMQTYKKYYFTLDPDLKMFNGLLPLLQNLKAKHVFLAVATGKSRVGLNRALEKHGITGLFDSTRTADQTLGKPNPLMLQEISEELVVAPQNMVMVGDTDHDIQMAHNFGCDSIAVSYGAAHQLSVLEKAKPTFIAHTVDELAQLLNVYTVKAY